MWRVLESVPVTRPTVPSIAASQAASSADPRSQAAAPAEVALSADETRELARLAVAMAVVVAFFALAGAAIVIETGDPASAIGATIMGGLAITLIHARHQLLRGDHGARWRCW